MSNLLKIAQKARESLSRQKGIDIGGGWLAYFEDEFVVLSWDSGYIIYSLELEYDTAFIHLPQNIGFFSEKIKSLLGRKPEELQIAKGKNVFVEIKGINQRLKQDDNDGKMLARYLIKVVAFNKVQFYSVDNEKTYDMPWGTFFVRLPEALVKMKERFEKVGRGKSIDEDEENGFLKELRTVKFTSHKAINDIGKELRG